MKKNKLLPALFVSVSAMTVCSQELSYNWGIADTVACHMIGPGMKYTKIIYPQKPLILWWVDVDLTNEYAKIEQVQSRHSVPDALRWDVMTHYRENSRPGHQVKVAWNHDFFSYDAGVCIGVNISEGEVTWTKTGRSVLAITEDKLAEVFYPSMDAHVTTSDGTQVEIDYFNGLSTGLYGDCVLYNRFNSKVLTEEGKYIGLRPVGKWLVNGDPIRCEVVEISDTPLSTDAGHYVLFLRGSKLGALDGHLNAGETLTITQDFANQGWGTPPARILNAFHGYPSIVHDGVLHDGEYNNFENGREYEKSSRVMAGISKDKTHLYIATTELSSNSTGVDCIELSAWMVENGAWDVVNFDSGGSAAIVIDETMLNVPGRGSVRPVEDAVLAVSLAPEDDNVDHLTFSVPYISPSVISRTPLRVMAFNKYDEVLEEDVHECTFECVPSDLGYVDDDGVFHSSEVNTCGKIYARKDGLVAEIDVTTIDIQNVTPAYTSLLIDNNRRYAIDINGVSATGMVTVDPGAFSWTSSCDGIVSVSEDGVLSGLAEGETRLTAEFGNVSFGIYVKVEIAEGVKTHETFGDLEGLNLSYTSAVRNASVDYAGLPQGWTSGAVVNFDLYPGRGSNIKLTPKMKLYSLPDSISLHVYDKTGAISGFNLTFVDALGERFSIPSGASQGDNTYYFAFKDDNGDIFPLYRYPLTLSGVTVNLNNKSIPSSQIAFGSIDAYYPGYGSGNADISADVCGDNMTLSLVGERLMVKFDAPSESEGLLSVYNVMGRRVLSEHVRTQSGTNDVTVDIKELPVGIYLVSLRGEGFERIGKFVVR